MRVAIYCRVSTAEQTVEMQLRDLRQLAAQRGFEIVAGYTDEGVSGAKDSRTKLDRMLADAQRGRFLAILATGASWKAIANRLDVGVGTVYAAML